ncbi:MAG: hypothetical protein OQL16_09525 [Gammaproteobacteria bacterium]|nr:hypothetical protein [Gammaproteobacteria bacterium]
MHSLRRHSFVKQWVSYISLLLLLQGLFPAQVHSQLVKDANGQLVEVCTLYGLKTIALDESGNPLDESSDNDSQRSAAMAFSQLIAEAVSDVTIPVVIQEDAPSWSFPVFYTVVIPEVTSALTPIRAPPVA